MKAILLVTSTNQIRIYGNCDCLKQAKLAGLKVDCDFYRNFKTVGMAKDWAKGYDDNIEPTVVIL